MAVHSSLEIGTVLTGHEDGRLRLYVAGGGGLEVWSHTANYDQRLPPALDNISPSTVVVPGELTTTTTTTGPGTTTLARTQRPCSRSSLATPHQSPLRA